MSELAQNEARRRVEEGAALIESAIRLGADPEFVARRIRVAVDTGAEHLAADTIEAYDKAAGRS